MLGLNLNLSKGNTRWSTVKPSTLITGALAPVGTANRLLDSGKNKTNLTVNSGGATQFDGATQYVSGVLSTFDSTSFTFSVNVVCFRSDSTDNNNILDSEERHLVRLQNGYIRAYDGSFTDVYPIVENQNYHIVIVQNNGIQYWYVDGVLEATTTLAWSNTCTNLWFKNQNAYRHYGQLSNLLILNQGLSTTEAEALYKYREESFSHFDKDVAFTSSKFTTPKSACLLNMPLNQIGAYQRDYSKAVGEELVVNGGFDSDSGWSIETEANQWVISNGVIASTGSSGAAYRNIGSVINTYYLIEFDIVSYTSGLAVVTTGGASATYRSGVGKYKEVVKTTNNDQNVYIDGANASPFVGSIDSISVKEIPSYEITNYTTSCDVVKQSTSLQMSQFEHDADTGLMGEWKPDRIHFDGLVYVDAVDTGWIPPSDEDWAIEVIQDFTESDGAFHLHGVRDSGEEQRLHFGQRSDGTVYVKLGTNSSGNPPISVGLHHVAVTYDSASKTATLHVDGANVTSVVNISYATPTISLTIGAETTSYYIDSATSYFKIWQGDEYAKFDPAKSWAKAQALITKWEAE